MYPFILPARHMASCHFHDLIIFISARTLQTICFLFQGCPRSFICRRLYRFAPIIMYFVFCGIFLNLSGSRCFLRHVARSFFCLRLCDICLRCRRQCNDVSCFRLCFCRNLFCGSLFCRSLPDARLRLLMIGLCDPLDFMEDLHEFLAGDRLFLD